LHFQVVFWLLQQKTPLYYSIAKHGVSFTLSFSLPSAYNDYSSSTSNVTVLAGAYTLIGSILTPQNLSLNGFRVATDSEGDFKTTRPRRSQLSSTSKRDLIPNSETIPPVLSAPERSETSQNAAGFFASGPRIICRIRDDCNHLRIRTPQWPAYMSYQVILSFGYWIMF
jgi:hypothetical protein